MTIIQFTTLIGLKGRDWKKASLKHEIAKCRNREMAVLCSKESICIELYAIGSWFFLGFEGTRFFWLHWRYNKSTCIPPNLTSIFLCSQQLSRIYFSLSRILVVMWSVGTPLSEEMLPSNSLSRFPRGTLSLKLFGELFASFFDWGLLTSLSSLKKKLKHSLTRELCLLFSGM